MGRPDDGHVRLARQVDVVMEAALAAEEANVLEALDRLPDAELLHPKLLLIVASACVVPARR
jgi:hypothetical protein